MPRVTRTEQAENDLLSIWEYIADDNSKSADKLLRLINERCDMLAEHPKLRPARPDLGQELRYLPVGSYLILYREIENGVEIVRVLHGARNLDMIFHGEE